MTSMLARLLSIGSLVLCLGALPGFAQGTYRFEGTILDANTQRTLPAEVIVYGATDLEEMSRMQTSRLGTFTMMAETPGPYRFVIKSPAYKTEELAPTATTPGTPATFTVRLTPLEVGAKVQLSSVRFKQSKAELLPESYPELLRLVAVLNANPTLEIKLNGHTDNVGDAAKNQKLSEERVQTVITYLTKAGITATRLSGQGFGGSQPVASNAQEVTRKLNRRVEFEIVKR